METFIRKQPIAAGETDRLRELLGEMVTEAKADPDGVMEIWSAETLRTLSLFIEHGAERDYLVWYIEAESMDRLVEAREASEHPLHDLEDELLAETLESTESATTFEPVFHGTHPERPGDFAVEGPR